MRLGSARLRDGRTGSWRERPKGVYKPVPDATLITVVETQAYLSAASEMMSDAERAAIVDRVAADPAAGDLMPGTGGLRKLRAPLLGRGKRGGARLITFFHDEGCRSSSS